MQKRNRRWRRKSPPCCPEVFHMRLLLQAVFACLMFCAPALAQGALSGVGVVLLHGKGGQPGGNIGGLASALQAEGAVVVMPRMSWAGSRGVVASYDTPFEASLSDIDGAVAALRAQGA